MEDLKGQVISLPRLRELTQAGLANQKNDRYEITEKGKELVK